MVCSNAEKRRGDVIRMLFSPDKITRGDFKGNAVCHYEIFREEVECSDYTRFDNFMAKLKSFRTIPKQKVMFSFAGYNDDKRELINIPEAVHYAKRLIEQYPYFWYYAITINSEFFVLADLFDDTNYTIVSNDARQKFYIKQDKESIQHLIRKMGAALEKFGEQLKDTEGALEAFKLWATFIMSQLT